MQYTKKLMDHFAHPHNQGVIKDANAIAEVGNIKCGDIMKLYLKISKNGDGVDYIEDIKFETLGCAAAIAATSVLTDLAKGKTLDSARKITKDDIVSVLESVPQIKYHCSILAQEGLEKAIKEYLENNKK